MDYAVLKLIHVSCALISYALFFVRGLWRFSDSPMLRASWVRIVPHVNDTVLLASAVGMAMTVATYPGMHAFLAGKIGGLIVYILLGMYALKWAKTKASQIAAWVLAQLVFLYIVAVAFTKSPALGM
jgi:uncharacterized membrane protein SirB2